jgi:uncharacterized damage-inducible protein DinB
LDEVRRTSALPCRSALEDLDRVVEFAVGSGPKQRMPRVNLLQHSATHGVHHRGQIALMLRMLGVAPGNVDLVLYFGEAPVGGAREVK